MTEEVVFEEPAVTDLRGLTRWVEVLRPLTLRPNEWARVKLLPKTKAQKLATQLRHNKTMRLPAGRWEILASPVPGRDEWGIYARYLGPDEDPANAQPRAGAAGPRRSAEGPAGRAASVPAAPPASVGGVPKCARKGCGRPAGKGSPWCVPQRWCEGRIGAAPSAPQKPTVPGVNGPAPARREVVDPLKTVVELPAPPEPMPRSRTLERMRERFGPK